MKTFFYSLTSVIFKRSNVMNSEVVEGMCLSNTNNMTIVAVLYVTTKATISVILTFKIFTDHTLTCRQQIIVKTGTRARINPCKEPLSAADQLQISCRSAASSPTSPSTVSANG